MDAAIKFVEALAKLLAVLAWPAVAVFVLVRFGSSLRGFMDGVAEFSLKGGGFEASAKTKQAAAAAALAAAEASRPNSASDGGRVALNARSAATVVAEVAPPRVIRRVSGSKVLWGR
jgi:hypothetical protein